MNNGQGYFTFDLTAFPVDNGRRKDDFGDLLTADLDGDGDLDLISPGFAPGGAIWINDGTGHFADETAARFPPSAVNYRFRTVEVGDVDHDGDLDVAITYPGYPPRMLLYLNDGHGVFTDVTATHLPANVKGGSALHFGDFDGDGDLDLLGVVVPNHVIHYQGEEVLLINDGTGHFDLDRDRRFFGLNPTGYARDVLIADLDGDGDLDAVEASSAAQPNPPRRLPYYINTLRHVYADAPPQRGTTWRPHVTGPVGNVAALALSFTPAHLDVPPLGRLGLDPTSLVLWQPAKVLDAYRDAFFDIPIPNLPRLQGVPLYVQGIVYEPTGLRLTNTWVEDAIQ